MRSLASKPFSAPDRLQPQQRLSRSRSTRPVEERHVLRSYGTLFPSVHPTRPVEERHVLRSSRTLFLSSVHPNGLRFPWTLGTLFPGDNQTKTRTRTRTSPSPPWNNGHATHPSAWLLRSISLRLQRHDRTRDRPTTTTPRRLPTSLLRSTSRDFSVKHTP